MRNDPQLSAMFEAVYSAPGDRQRRQVLADALLQAGAPRGEFIALQLDGSSRARKRAMKLLERHRAEWLGPLFENVVAGTDDWRDGFLSAAHVRLRGDRCDEPSWATLERLVLHWQSLPPRELGSPHLKSLKALKLSPVDHGAVWVSNEYAVEEREKIVAAVRDILASAGREALLKPGQEWLWRRTGEWMWLSP